MMFGFDPGEPRTFERLDNETVVCASWIPTLLAVAAGAVPWALRRRFSLRTLLIATTLMAVVLGMIVYMLRTKPVLQPPNTPIIQPMRSKDPLFGAMPPRSENNFPATWLPAVPSGQLQRIRPTIHTLTPVLA